MAKRNGPVHVATIKRVSGGKAYQSHLLRRTYREDGKVKHETLGNISHLPPHVVDIVRASLRGEPCVVANDAFEILRTLPHGHVVAVLGTLGKLALEQLLASRPCRERTLVVAMICARVFEPGSKLATARGLNAETCSSSLGQVLGVESVSEDDLYEAMDWIQQRQRRVETKLAKRHLEDGCLVLYDLSSSYYTGTKCPLAKRGHCRDKKKGFAQIVYGLLCNAEGCPVAIEVFEGNTGDPKTLGAQIQKIRQRFHLKRVVLVGDRGMITSARIREELRPVEGLDWITALRAPAIKKLAEERVVQPSLFDEKDLAEVSSPDYPDERLVVCRNPLLAQERTRKREDLLKATEKKLNEIVAATQRAKRPLKDKEKITFRVAKHLNRYKMAKHFDVKIGDDSFSYERKTEQIRKEAALDGMYVIRTSVAKEIFTAESTVEIYKSLSTVERAFRSLKTVDLKIRPIYHHLEDRVRAHVFLCMLAYYVEWHMRRALVPILFDDDDKESAEAARSSIVAPAQRSERARRKAATKRTEDDYPVHSFRGLLKDLHTLAKNRVRTQGGGATEFYILTTPTALQSRAFDLLGVSATL
jgi:transposase